MLALRRFGPETSLLALLFLVGCGGSDADLTGPSFSATQAPSGTEVSAVSESRIDVSWQDNSSDERGFEVHRSATGPNSTFILLATTAANVTGYSDAGLTASTEYCYKVRSFKTTGRKTRSSAFSAATCATTLTPPPPPPPPSGPPGAPYSVHAQPWSSNAVEVHWWDSSANEDGFRVERSTDGGASWTVAGTAEATSFHGFFFDGNRATEQQVCYRVIAFNGEGDSAPSDAVCTAPPAGPTNLTGTWADGTIDLTWTDNSAVEDGYLVVITTTCGEQPDYEIDAVPANSTSYRHYGWEEWWLSTGCRAVGYYVLASRDGGQSDRSNVAAPQP